MIQKFYLKILIYSYIVLALSFDWMRRHRTKQIFSDDVNTVMQILIAALILYNIHNEIIKSKFMIFKLGRNLSMNHVHVLFNGRVFESLNRVRHVMKTTQTLFSIKSLFSRSSIYSICKILFTFKTRT